MRSRIRRRRRSAVRSRAAAGIIDYVLKLLAWFEIRDLLGGNLDPRAGFGVAADSGLPLARAKTAKSANLDLIAGAQGAHDAVENGLYNDLGLFPGHFHYARDF